MIAFVSSLFYLGRKFTSRELLRRRCAVSSRHTVRGDLLIWIAAFPLLSRTSEASTLSN